jgi:hypothetical protein
LKTILIYKMMPCALLPNKTSSQNVILLVGCINDKCWMHVSEVFSFGANAS